MRARGSVASRDKKRRDADRLEILEAHARLTALGVGRPAAPLRERIDELVDVLRFGTEVARLSESIERVKGEVIAITERAAAQLEEDADEMRVRAELGDPS